MSGYEVVQAVGNPSTADYQAQVATCPTGKKILGGGGYPAFDTGVNGLVNLVAIHASAPNSLFGDNDAWDVQAFETSPDNVTRWHLVVWAVCASVG